MPAKAVWVSTSIARFFTKFMLQKSVVMNNFFDSALLDKVGEILHARKQTIAVAESATGGFLQAALSSIMEASRFFQGGITAYNLGQKCRHLQVEPVSAQDCNCVSESVAAQMAAYTCNMFSSHWGLSITGYASPVPQSGGSIFAYYAIARQGVIVASGSAGAVSDDAMENQLSFVRDVVKAFLQVLEKGE